MDLRNAVFELTENEAGHATANTVMTFDDSVAPFRATYSGPNVSYGHVIVENNLMLYHARDNEGNLSAGVAEVSVNSTTMTLHWSWLTGDHSSGVSVWSLVDAASAVV